MRANSTPSDEIELQRERVTAAELLLKQADEQASWAKRRRKLAKLLAKRARQGAKQAKANLKKAKAVLARAESILAGRGDRRATVKTGKSKSVQRRSRKHKKHRKPSVGTLPASAMTPEPSGPLEEILCAEFEAQMAQTGSPASKDLTHRYSD